MNDDDYSDEDDDWGEENEWEDEGGEAQDVNSESQAYLDFLSEEASKFSNLTTDNDDELEEESLLETPLDNVEPYGVLKGSLVRLQQEQPEFYGNLMQHLEQQEQQILQTAVQQADTIAVHALQQQQQAQAQAHVPVPQTNGAV